nr:hypothetical protein [Tanacetum cinerariifolium]
MTDTLLVSYNNSSHDLPSLHPLIDHHCCYEYGNSLNDFFCYQCTCKFCGNGAHVGYTCAAQVPSVQTLPSFPQQYPCCEDYGVTHKPYHCQPKNHDYYNEQNSFFDSNSFGFDQSQPQQYTVNHLIFNAHNDYLDSQIQLNNTLAKITEQMTSITSLCEMACKFVQKKLEEKQLEEERAAKAKNWKLSVCYDDDDDEERSDSLDDNIISGLPLFSAITPNEPVLSTVEPDNSLKETHNFDNSLPEFTTFSNVLCDVEYESDSSDDQLCSDEDVLKKIVSKPLSEEEIIPMKSLRTHDSSLPISSKIDSLLDEFKLLYDNSSPRPLEEFVSANSDAKIKSFSPSPILVKDSDSLMEEIDLFCTLDYPMPSGIVDEDYDSEGDILIPKDLPSNNTLSFAEKESFHFDIPLFCRPPAKPPDGDTGILNIKMMGDIYDQKAFMHKLMITLVHIRRNLLIFYLIGVELSRNSILTVVT